MNNSLTTFKGICHGMELSGGKFIKVDETHVYFEIKKGSLLDDKEGMQNALKIFKHYGWGLKIKKV